MKNRMKPISVSRFPRSKDSPPLSMVPVFRSLNIVDVFAPSICPRHQHDGFEVIVVEQGPYHYLLNDKKSTLDSGEMLVVKPGDWHEDYYTPPLRFFGINFDLGKAVLGNVAFSIFSDSVRPDQQRLHARRKELWPILARLRKESEVADGVTPYVQDALLQEFFWRLIRALPKEALAPWFLIASSQQAFVAELMRLFYRSVTMHLSLAQLAQGMKMSESALAHKCKAILNVSPAKAFAKYKMERACLLLQHTSMTIKDISAYLGFENPYHFSRTFKKHLGIPPSLVR